MGLHLMSRPTIEGAKPGMIYMSETGRLKEGGGGLGSLENCICAHELEKIFKVKGRGDSISSLIWP